MKKILVTSGKGGVGKSTITVNLARILSRSGFRVGILDIDIDCPNIPEFMGCEERNLELTDDGIKPKVVDEIEVMSLGFMADTDLAIMWDGERRSMAVEQMLNRVDWTCDVLLIDSPPGTTDEVMTMITKFDPDVIVIVTTNHKASIADVKRTISMIKLLKSEDKILGIVRNLDHMRCPECDTIIPLFKGNIDAEIDELTIAQVPYGEDERIQESLGDMIDKIIDDITR